MSDIGHSGIVLLQLACTDHTQAADTCAPTLPDYPHRVVTGRLGTKSLQDIILHLSEITIPHFPSDWYSITIGLMSPVATYRHVLPSLEAI